MKRALLTAVALATMSTNSDARPARINQIPNAPNSCGTCHINPAGGGARNVFGQDVQATMIGTGASGVADWSALFDLDSDNDGFTNGAELADPDGSWSTGDDRPSGVLSDPADANSTPDDPGDVMDDGGGGCQNTAGDSVTWSLLAVGLAGWFMRRRTRRA